jgi:hypothetical protein
MTTVLAEQLQQRPYRQWVDRRARSTELTSAKRFGFTFRILRAVAPDREVCVCSGPSAQCTGGTGLEVLRGLRAISQTLTNNVIYKYKLQSLYGRTAETGP